MKEANKYIAIALGTCVAGWLGIAGLFYSLSEWCNTKSKDQIPNREYIIENAEILEFKKDLDYLVLRDKKNTNNMVRLSYGAIEEFNEPQEVPRRKFARPFALVRDYSHKTNAAVYPLNGISVRSFIKD